MQISTLKEGQMKNAIMDTVEDMCRNPDLPSGISYDAAIKHIVKKIQNTDTVASEVPTSELAGYVKDYMSQEEFEELKEDAFDQGGEDEQLHHEEQPEQPQGDEHQGTAQPKIIGKADEYKVELDGDEQVHITDGEGTVRLSMPFLIWKQLIRG
jgi:hypothetical protein